MLKIFLLIAFSYLGKWIEAAKRLRQAALSAPRAPAPAPAEETAHMPAMSSTATIRRVARYRRPTTSPCGVETVLDFYAARCAGCRELAYITGSPVFKLGFTTYQLDERMRRLNREHYAGLIRVDGRWIAETGFDTWEVQPIAAPASLLGGAILRRDNALSVRLPPGLTALAFDAALKEALAGFSFDALVESRTALRSDPRLIRYTHRGGSQPARAIELYAIRPRLDGERIVGAIRAIIAEHRHGGALRPSAPKPMLVARRASRRVPD